MKTKSLFAACAALVMGFASAAVTPGVVSTDFTASRKYAEANNVPLAVFWGNTGCDYCNSLQKALAGSAAFGEWLSEHKILFVEKHEEYDSTDADHLAAKNWIKSIDGKLTKFPFVGLYWKKPGGSVVKVAFAGRAGMMPVTTPKGDLAGQLVGTLEKYFGEYVGGVTPVPPTPVDPGESGDASFVTSDTAYDRLEAEPSTETVYVPLVRATAAKAASNALVATYPDRSERTFAVAWKAGEAEKCVAVPVAGKWARGRKVDLSLEDARGARLDASSVAFVQEMENLPVNPHWVGEHTARSLPYGEWTMDFDTAKEKVRLYGGKLVAMFGGPLWCPNCKAIEDDVFSTRKFKDWARRNKLVLVHFDQGEASSPSTAAGTPYCRLLTYDGAVDHIDGSFRSGASYLSRHGIDPDSAEVKAAIDRVTFLTDAWLAPESTAARLSNPVVLLLNDDGTAVDARFQRQNVGYEMDLAENMYRLEDLLTLAGDDETKGYRTVTPLTLQANSGAALEFHVNSRRYAFRLEGVGADDYVRATVTSADRNAQAVTVAIVDADGVELASGEGRVTTATPVGARQSKGLFVIATGYGKDVQSATYGRATSFAATLEVAAGGVEMMRTVELADLTKTERKAVNPLLGTRRTTAVPVFAEEAGGRRFAGTLTVSQTTSDKLTAKYAGPKSVTFSGAWREANLLSGVVSADLTAKNGDTLALSMDTWGCVSAALTAGGVGLAGAGATGDLSAYAGRYTVTLVDSAGEAGTGHLALNVSKTGKASVSGVMPDGASVSVTAALCPNGDGTATLAVLKSGSKGTLSLALVIDANAAATWGDEGNTGTVGPLPGCLQTWTAAGRTTSFEVYGGFWKKGASPLEICELYGLGATLGLTVGGEEIGEVTATKSGFKFTKGGALKSLSFSKTTGVFSGKATLPLDGGSLSGTFRGVLLPGWIDCGCTGEPVVERPYGSGTFCYTATENGKKVTKSIPLDLNATSAN